MSCGPENLQESVMVHAGKDFTLLRHGMSVREALDFIRSKGVAEKIVYFYVGDEAGRLIGVLPTRKLLTSQLDQLVSDIMVENIVAIPHTATVMDACELFAIYKLLAFPVTDDEGRMLGQLDVSLFTDEVFEIAQYGQLDAIFEAIGFNIAQVKNASSLKVFRYRFPWLLNTVASGLICAFLASVFETTLAQSIVLAFFLTLLLGLGESVSIQSMTVTIQALRAVRPTFKWYVNALFREVSVGFLLGASLGLIVAVAALFWRGFDLAALVIGISICLSLCMACVFGISIPALLHALKLDPKIAAGPLTLALADIATVLFYFSLAALIL